MKNMQTILGSGGAIGISLARALQPYDIHVRLMSRNPKKVAPENELFPGDLLDAAAVDRAVTGSSVVYLTAGLPYKYKEWKAQWPVIMKNVIEACKKHRSKLVFFDNAYMYDPTYLNDLTESTPVRPVSKKGEVRAQIARQLLNEMGEGSIEAMIVRAADFYGPGINTSMMMETGFKKLRAGKKPMWLGNPAAYHSMTYTPDAARATSLLGNTPDAYGEIWHLPTDQQKITGKSWIELFAGEMRRPAKFSAISGRTIRMMGWVIPFFKEVGEMMYQFDHNYFFNSRKFMDRFPDFRITPPEEAVREIIEAGS